MIRKSSFIILLVLLLQQAVSAAPLIGTGLEVAHLGSLRVLIEDLSETTKQLGLTDDVLKDKIELRLRRNRITPSDSRTSDYFLYLNLGTTQNSYSFTLEFSRSLVYRVGEQEYSIVAPVWIKNGFGVNTDRRKMRDDIVNRILDRVDTFSNEFLKVNRR